jgi:uncharacterized membrane protein YagU involved in acid resistance
MTIGSAVTIGAAVGIAASWVKSLSEPRLQKLFERLVQPTEAEKELVGADPSGHPERMPPAEVADRLARRVSGHGLSQQQRVSVLNPVHYAFGAAVGVAYVGAARLWPAVTRDLGVPAGLAIYGSTHAGVLPILRIQEPPWKLPMSAALWESTSHVLFGIALEGFRRTFARLAAAAAGIIDRAWTRRCAWHAGSSRVPARGFGVPDLGSSGWRSAETWPSCRFLASARR